MRYSQWIKSPVALRRGFNEFCRFKQFDEKGEANFLVEMAHMPIQGRPEQHKAPYLLDATILFMLAQVPQSLWSEALSHLFDYGIYALQQEMKNAGIEPLAGGYLGGTEGTEEEHQHYLMIRNYLKRKPPYEFIKLGGNIFLIVNHPNVNISPSASMYLKIDNSVNTNWFREKRERDRTDRSTYIQQAITQNYGMHGDYLNTFDPQEIKPKDNPRYPYHLWQGYQGMNKPTASRVLKDYFNHLHWYHIPQNPNTDDAKIAELRRQYYDQAQKDPNLMHERIKTGGRPGRREQLVPILSGNILKTNMSFINNRRNQVIAMMSPGVKKDWHIILNPDGSTNVEIGIRSNHRVIFQKLNISPSTAKQINDLLSDPSTNQKAAEAQMSPSSYIAQLAGIQGGAFGTGKNRIKYNPEQIIQAIMNDSKIHDAGIYPYWDSEKKLHNASDESNAYVQAIPMHAPQKLIPQETYMQHRYHHQLFSWMAKEIKNNNDDFNKFLILFKIIPQTDLHDIKDYARHLRNAEFNTTYPPVHIRKELKQAGFDIPLREAQEETQKQKISWDEIIRGMEIALFARAFQYWLTNERKPELRQLPNNKIEIDQLLDEFSIYHGSKAEDVLKNAKLGNVFDYHLEKIHGGSTWGTAYSFGRNPQHNSPWTVFGTHEEWVKFQKIVEEEERYTIFNQVVKGIRDFINSSQSKSHQKNRQIITEKTKDIAEEALSEYQNSKGARKVVWHFIELRDKITKEGGHFAPNGKIVDLNNPALEKEYDRAKQALERNLRHTGLEFASRIWQLNLGWGSRKQVERKGASIDASKQALEDEYGVGAAFLISPEDKELLEGQYGARSLEERGREHHGQIFGPAIRRRYELAKERLTRLNKEAEQFQKKYGLDWNKLPEEDRTRFQQLVLKLRTQTFDARTEAIIHVAEAAKRAKYNELSETGMDSKNIEKEMEDAARIAVKKYLDQMDHVFTGATDESEFINSLGDRWKQLKPKQKINLRDIIYSIEQQYFDKLQHHLMVDKTAHFQDYINKIKQISQHQYHKEIEIDKNFPELFETMDEIKKEEEGNKKYKDQPGPFKVALLRLVAHYNDTIQKYLTVVSTEQRQKMIQDLETFTNPHVLQKSHWREEAEKILEKQKYYDRNIPNDIFAQYAPRIKEALSRAA